MNQRRAGNGRPSGTDGSDFSYRMVVDNRYTKVAQGKSRLSMLIFAQAIFQLLTAVKVFLSTMEEDNVKGLAISPIIIGFISLMIGELGRKRSKVSYLKLFVRGTSVSTMLSIACLSAHLYSLEVLKDLSPILTSKLELLSIGGTLLGLTIQMLTVTTTMSLIHNMKPPKKGS